MASTKERIIEATATLFMQQGYAASGLKQISDVSAAPIGSLYHHFPGGKAELAAETLRAAGHLYQTVVESVIDSSPDIVSGIRNCFLGAAEVLRLSDYADACPVATVALEVASSDEPLRAVTETIFAGWLASATARFEAAGIEPEPARRLATLFVGALEGGFLLSRVAKDAGAMERIGALVVAAVESALEP